MYFLHTYRKKTTISQSIYVTNYVMNNNNLQTPLPPSC